MRKPVSSTKFESKETSLLNKIKLLTVSNKLMRFALPPL